MFFEIFFMFHQDGINFYKLIFASRNLFESLTQNRINWSKLSRQGPSCNFYWELQIKSMSPFFPSQIPSSLRSESFFLLFFPSLVSSTPLTSSSLSSSSPHVTKFRVFLSYLWFLFLYQQCLLVFIFQHSSVTWPELSDQNEKTGELPASLALTAMTISHTFKNTTRGYFGAYMMSSQDNGLNLLHPEFIILNSVHAKPTCL